jgi:hypothetical protein
VKAAGFFLQAIAFARISGYRGGLAAHSGTQGPFSLALSRSTGTGRRSLLLTPTPLSLLIQILQFREEPAPPAQELPFL